METCYKQLTSKNLHDVKGQFSASAQVSYREKFGVSIEYLFANQVCILFNNMAHVKSQLDKLSQELEVEAVCKRMQQGRTEETVRTLENLKRSAVEDIANKILISVRQFSKMLAPDITAFIKNIMISADVNASIEVRAWIIVTSSHDLFPQMQRFKDLQEFLNKNLKTFSEYLLDDVFHKYGLRTL